MKILLIVLFLFCFLKGYSQDTDNDYTKLIDSAIGLKVTHQFESRNLDPNNSLLNNLYLIDENGLPYKCSSSKLKKQFKSINIYDPANKKILINGISAWKISTLLKNNRFIINIIDYKITYKMGRYNYANGGGAKTIFEYSCTENKWVLKEFKSAGI